MEDNLPKGIPFTSIKSGETLYVKLEAQIQAFINSSDMGINASRGQDFAWRLGPEWVIKVKQYRRNEAKMERLIERNGGQAVTTPQILYAIYGEELRAAQERAHEEDAPFEEAYLQAISGKEEKGIDNADSSEPTDNTDGISESVQEVNAVSDSDKPTDSKTKAVANKK